MNTVLKGAVPLNDREWAESRENAALSPFAAKSADAGRHFPIDPCELRTAFCRDRDRITHSKSFRRLMHKTQVFIAPEGDHFRTRLTHTLEVAQIARAIARALRLNEDLTEAIALAHDLGHTPFGHAGESALNEIMADFGGFRHNEQSERVVRVIEALNLTTAVIDGVLNHRTNLMPATLEGQVVRLSDKIAYINHDIDDACRAGVLNPGDLPRGAIRLLGETPSARIDYLIRSVIRASRGKPSVVLESDAREALWELRGHMFRTVYQSQIQFEERVKIKGVMSELFRLYSGDTALLPETFRRLAEIDTPGRVVGDFIAGMTDRYAMRVYVDNFVPESWKLH